MKGVENIITLEPMQKYQPQKYFLIQNFCQNFEIKLFWKLMYKNGMLWNTYSLEQG